MNDGFYGFKSALKMTAIRTTNTYRLDDCLAYLAKDFCFYSVPTGFVTDLASIPRFAKGIIDDNDPDIRDAAVLHDFLYSVQGINKYGLSRQRADFILREAMQSLSAPWWKRQSAYWIVRFMGKSHFGGGA